MLVFEHDLTMDVLLENGFIDVVTIVTYTKYVQHNLELEVCF